MDFSTQDSEITSGIELLGLVNALLPKKPGSPQQQPQISLHGYGADKLTPSLHGRISKRISPVTLGETGENLGSLLMEIEKTNKRTEKDDQKNIMLIFLSGSKSSLDDTSTIGESVKSLRSKGYHVVVVGTSPGFSDEEARKIFTPQSIILDVGSEPSEDAASLVLPTLERILADVAFGK